MIRHKGFAHLAKSSPSVAGWNVLGPESSEVNVKLDEKTTQSAGNASHEYIDRQLPYVVPEPRAIQRNVVIVQSQVSPNAKAGVKDLAWLFVKLRQKVQSANSCASCQKTPPEQRCAVERSSLFNRQQEATDGSSEGA